MFTQATTFAFWQNKLNTFSSAQRIPNIPSIIQIITYIYRLQRFKQTQAPKKTQIQFLLREKSHSAINSSAQHMLNVHQAYENDRSAIISSAPVKINTQILALNVKFF